MAKILKILFPTKHLPEIFTIFGITTSISTFFKVRLTFSLNLSKRLSSKKSKLYIIYL